MKNRSFLFLIAALAMGLALFGCSTDDGGGGTDYVTTQEGWAGDVEDIAAAFDKVDQVYLTKGITIDGGQTLSIKAGKTLYLNGNTITMEDNSSVVTASVTSIVWSGEERAVVTGKIVVADGAAVCLIGPEGSFPTASVTGDLAKVVELAPATSGSLSYTESDGRAFAATNNRALVFNEADGAWRPTAGGTRVVYIGDLEIPATPGGYVIGGSLSVAGNVTLAGTLAGADGEIEVLGKLTSNISTGAEGITLAAGKVTARNIATKGGKFAKAGSITAPSLSSLFEGTLSTFGATLYAAGPVQFTKDAEFTGATELENNAAFDGDVTFTAASNIGGNAAFGGNVTFTAASKIGGGAAFANNKEIVGEVEVGGQLSAGASGTNTLLLAPGGQIIYRNGVANSFLTGVGTLATLTGELGTLSFSIKSDELAVSGAGSLVIGNQPITLTGANTIKIDGTTGVYFSETGGKIVADAYDLGGQVGTLSNENGAIGGFILSKDGVTNAVTTSGSASLLYTLEDGEDKVFLHIKEGSQATLTGVNVKATVGSISFGPSAILYLAPGGSVTATGDPAHNGYIVSIPSGSLVAGSTTAVDADAIAAGSAGTVGRSYIHSTSKFIVSTGSAATAVGSASSNPFAGATTEGSIAVFAAYEE